MRFKLKINDTNNVFANYGKLRMEDFISLANNQKLKDKERQKLGNIAYQIKRGVKENKDWYYQKNKDTISFF